MAHDGLKVLDSDMHCMEPADLWCATESAYKPFAPRGLVNTSPSPDRHRR
jgi:hypothetical protein